jgi:hypothetical protein
MFMNDDECIGYILSRLNITNYNLVHYYCYQNKDNDFLEQHTIKLTEQIYLNNY